MEPAALDFDEPTRSRMGSLDARRPQKREDTADTEDRSDGEKKKQHRSYFVPLEHREPSRRVRTTHRAIMPQCESDVYSA